jgi:hypothetical protein
MFLMLKRSLKITLVCVLLGVVTTYAVAWGSALALKYDLSRSIPTVIVHRLN